MATCLVCMKLVENLTEILNEKSATTLLDYLRGTTATTLRLSLQVTLNDTLFQTINQKTYCFAKLLMTYLQYIMYIYIYMCVWVYKQNSLSPKLFYSFTTILENTSE